MNLVKDYPRLKINGVYKHFKETVNGEQSIYILTALAQKLPHNLNKEDLVKLSFIREDTRKEIEIYRLGHNHFYDEEDMNGFYVIYTGLYWNRLTYLRHIDVFFSEVEKERQHLFKQKNRFELIGELKFK